MHTLFKLLLLLPVALVADVKVAVSYPYIASITKEIGGDEVETIVLAKGSWDPHFVVPRPSLIAKVRAADAIIINGGQLEIGWLPPLIKRAGNAKTVSGASTYLDLSKYIEFLERPNRLDRADGDIHPQGNPHFHLDPKNVLKLSEVIKDFLINIDIQNKIEYEKNHQNFTKKLKEKMQEWDAKMADKKGLKVIQFHNNLAYFNHAYHLINIATIEPLPGIPPSSKHTIRLIKLIHEQKPYAILHDVYHSKKTAEFISSKTAIPIIEMPHDVEAKDGIVDIFTLFDYLTDAMR
ncbi:MAG: zinc ABC transporter substrate-binding protein [Campylobacterales bacterium]|nr:zinc ABC transporter substrate-binding protein [Campylobacterales bacterium]